MTVCGAASVRACNNKAIVRVPMSGGLRATHSAQAYVQQLCSGTKMVSFQRKKILIAENG